MAPDPESLQFVEVVGFEPDDLGLDGCPGAPGEGVGNHVVSSSRQGLGHELTESVEAFDQDCEEDEEDGETERHRVSCVEWKAAVALWVT